MGMAIGMGGEEMQRYDMIGSRREPLARGIRSLIGYGQLASPLNVLRVTR